MENAEGGNLDLSGRTQSRALRCPQSLHYEAGETWTCSEDLVHPKGETLNEPREASKWYQRALEQPALEYEDLAPDYALDSLDIEESL